MPSHNKIIPIATTFLAAAVCLAGGCSSSAKKSPATPATMTAPGRPALSQPQPGQPEFDTPILAAQALMSAAQAQDRAAAHRLFGTSAADLDSGDAVEDANSFKNFSAHIVEGVRYLQPTPDSAQLYIGDKDWPFPIPLAKTADGKWYYDTSAGKATILARRIGHNEIETIAVCHAYVEAQRSYGSVDRDGDGVLQYAQRLNSHPGQHDGLYWPTAPGETESPFGPLAAQAAAEGYTGPVKGAARSPFHGYLFRVLTKQGSAAPGGKYDYVINGRMIAGFALIAWPDKYGSSGVMTFTVNQYGQIYQKDLGEKTADLAPKITAYDPDSTWSPVK